MLKLLLTLISLHCSLATDLYSWTPAQTFTVGQPHPNVYAHPNNYSDFALADHNDCSSINTLGGIGSFINYDKSSPTYYLSFQSPSFTTPAGTCTLLLKFHKCTSSCYWEHEPVSFTIINQPPIIQDPKNNLIYVEDGKTISESYVPYDIEMSTLT
jgi:hypothetical protein